MLIEREKLQSDYNAETVPISHAAAVKRTNDSCTVSKWSVVDTGYYSDDVLPNFVDSKSKRRASLINRCYAVRYICLEQLVTKFFDLSGRMVPGKELQVISLGAGFDSSFWRLSKKFPGINLRFVEVDFPDVCRRKCSLAKAGGHLNNAKIVDDLQLKFLLEYDYGENKRFLSVGCDMTNQKLLNQTLGGVLLKDVPTIVISEVVFVYMKMEYRMAALKYVFESIIAKDLLIFLTYEQLARPDRDAFCKTMLTSFTQQQSPLLSYFKSPEDVISFWQNNFSTSCDVVFKTCSEVFNADLPEEHRRAHCNLEPVFDEFEPFHMKCSFYFVALACFGELRSTFANFIRNPYLPFDEKAENLTTETVESPIRSYAFSTCSIDSGCYFLGGFGNQNDQRLVHSRSRSINKFDPSTGDIMQLTLEGVDGSFFERMHSTSTALPGNRIFVFGGRRSPTCSVLSYGILRIDGQKCIAERIEQLPSNLGSHAPSPRFRHSACFYTKDDRNYILIHGGRYVDSKSIVFNDFWRFDVENFTWSCMAVEDVTRKRHSHSMIAKGDLIYLFGGLDDHEIALPGLLKITIGNNSLIKVEEISNSFEARYGHSVTLNGDFLVIVGGICPIATPFATPEITVFNLKTGSARHFMSGPTADPFMFANHGIFVDEDKQYLVVFGGGANCFSFGTHFNSRCLRIPFSKLL